MEEDGGYSQASDWEMEGRGSYGRGASYANRRKHYVRGHYSSEDGASYRGGRGGSRGGYSREGGREEMMEHVRMAMESAPEDYKEDIRRFLREIEG